MNMEFPFTKRARVRKNNNKTDLRIVHILVDY
jgi:hypothetical protein